MLSADWQIPKSPKKPGTYLVDVVKMSGSTKSIVFRVEIHHLYITCDSIWEN